MDGIRYTRDLPAEESAKINEEEAGTIYFVRCISFRSANRSSSVFLSYNINET